jgi:hypothetical protein
MKAQTWPPLFASGVLRRLRDCRILAALRARQHREHSAAQSMAA